MAKLSEMDKGFYAGLITALAIVALHDSETIYREIIETMNKAGLRQLIQHARDNDELEFSGLIRYGYARRPMRQA